MSRVLTVGSINMDIVARLERFPRRGETVMGSSLSYFPGGKGANQAISAARAGASSSLVGAVGGDDFGRVLRDYLGANGVDLAYVRTVEAEGSGTALILVAANSENEIVVLPGANSTVSPVDIEQVPVAAGDVVTCQCEIPLWTVQAALVRGRSLGAVTLLNPAPAREVSHEVLALADIVILNETELAALSGIPISQRVTRAVLTRAVRSLQDAAASRGTSPSAIIVTLGARGAVTFTGEDIVATAGHRVHAVDTTAAGDCFVGSLAARLALGDTLVQAVRYANLAASIAVQRHGAGPSLPLYEEVMSMVC